MNSQYLHDYILENKKKMTDEWLEQLLHEEGTMYSANISGHERKKLISQNQEFIEKTTKILIESDPEGFNSWARTVAENRVKTQTPLYLTIKNFKIFRTIYLTFIEQFVKENSKNIDPLEVGEWSRRINYAFDLMIELFTKHFNEYTNIQLQAQQEMIVELSAPIIKLTNEVGVLPLVGEIDTYRAQLIQQKALQQSMEYGLEYMIMDLSGVPIIDTMVAQELFQVIQSLSLLGIQAIITGIRPEIAQTAVQLGIDFGNVSTYAHLHQALTTILGDEPLQI